MTGEERKAKERRGGKKRERNSDSTDTKNRTLQLLSYFNRLNLLHILSSSCRDDTVVATYSI
jgi:hypothetical protein